MSEVCVKDIVVKVLPFRLAHEFVRAHHYSGKVVNNSVLHFGCFLENRLHGVMSFGSPLDKRKVLPLVHTAAGVPCLWNEMLELNRLAFDDVLPKNSESRCLSVAFRLLKKNAPHIRWVLTFADATQCGKYFVIEGSGNLSSNARIEQYRLEQSAQTYNFHAQWMTNVQAEIGTENTMQIIA